MDAKSKASFINSVTPEVRVKCPKCGADNKQENKFCLSCGAEMARVAKAAFESTNTTPENVETKTKAAFESVGANTSSTAADADKAAKEVEESPTVVKEHKKYIEPTDAFAKGLPEWSLEPPRMPVRR